MPGPGFFASPILSSCRFLTVFDWVLKPRGHCAGKSRLSAQERQRPTGEGLNGKGARETYLEKLNPSGQGEETKMITNIMFAIPARRRGDLPSQITTRAAKQH